MEDGWNHYRTPSHFDLGLGTVEDYSTIFEICRWPVYFREVLLYFKSTYS